MSKSALASVIAVPAGFLFPLVVFASSGEASSGGHAGQAALVLAFLGILVVLAKIAGAIAERCKQVSVLGELLLGIALGIPALLGFHLLDGMKTNEFVLFVSELAVIVLLFQAGLESNLSEMKKVGIRAFLVACVGVVAPFVLGTWVVAPWLFPDASSNLAIFLGATMTATSVGITARVFKDLKISHTPSAKIVLGAAVFDDVIGLLILAVVNGMVQSGHVSMGEVAIISLKAFGFLAVSIVLGRIFAPKIGDILSRIQSGIGMKMALALAFAFGYAYIGSLFGLAPIVGAFAAGLLLDAVHFRRFAHPSYTNDIEASLGNSQDAALTENLRKTMQHHRDHHVEHLIEDFGQWFIPVFFVITGMSVDLNALANPKVLFAALVLTIAAVIGKIVSGFVAGKEADWKIVGFGMVPRGEVGLIFASIGKATGVVNDAAFATLVVMIILTTFVTPIILPRLVKRTS